jgi:hypothetical protein
MNKYIEDSLDTKKMDLMIDEEEELAMRDQKV